MEGYVFGVLMGLIVGGAMVGAVVYQTQVPEAREQTCKVLQSEYLQEGNLCVKGDTITYRF